MFAIFIISLILIGLSLFCFYKVSGDALAVFAILVGTVSILIGTVSIFIVILSAINTHGLNGQVVDGIIDEPETFVIYTDDNNGAYKINKKNEDFVFVDGTNIIEVETIMPFTYKYKIPRDCIVWTYQPYKEMYK